jgi:single-strand DNA-binding protein
MTGGIPITVVGNLPTTRRCGTPHPGRQSPRGAGLRRVHPATSGTHTVGVRLPPARRPARRRRDFTVASTARVFDQTSGQWRDGDPVFLRCNLWRQPAEHLVDSLGKGARVVLTGRLQQRSYDTPNGDKRTIMEIQAEELGASIRYATVAVNKTSRAESRTDTRSDVGQHSPAPSGEPPF